MGTANALPRSVIIIRWIARIWSFLVFAVAILEIFVPDPNATEPVPLADWCLLSLWEVAIFGVVGCLGMGERGKEGIVSGRRFLEEAEVKP